ncbi:hypothetical protein B0T11DRAFT_106043 [Plectosphaerella cucumerina]|uniref:Uncharacterized protein n=1 Tax=Plectosphaerella cucumerina TaxID=40658 RepID=A0A8K0X1V5_9PEZI|nr:hypothetical protein B0T11DRAFT_106043 [Plectosphaerella cucumerina]
MRYGGEYYLLFLCTRSTRSRLFLLLCMSCWPSVARHSSKWAPTEPKNNVNLSSRFPHVHFIPSSSPSSHCSFVRPS